LSEIDGTPVATFIERDLDPYISSSTMQDRQLQRMRMLLDGPPDSTARTKWRTIEGGTIDVALTRNRSKNRQALRLPSHDPYEQKLYPGGVAYIALNSFDNNEIVKRFEANFEQLREAPAWIIDLRMNGGGSSSIGYAILKHFIDSTLSGSKQRSRLYNPTTEARGRPQSYFEWETDQIEPAAGAHYRGPVYVLTSPSTCSAAEDFLVPLRIAKRIVTVGEPTCGSTGQPLQFTIYGATGRICTKWDQYPDGTDFVGLGVTPDVPVARSAKDVAAGRDAVLEKALELASAKLK